MRTLMLRLTGTLFLVLTLLTMNTACIAEPIEIEFVARTPDQMGSFYEARGFPVEMLDVIKKQCLITTRIHNTSDDVVWLEMKNWHFSVNCSTTSRKTRAQWKDFWSAMDIPLSKQATFHWTQIPDVLDYLPGEEEGGNITLPRTDQPITIKASFATGKDKKGPVFQVEYHNIYCADDKP